MAKRDKKTEKQDKSRKQSVTSPRAQSRRYMLDRNTNLQRDPRALSSKVERIPADLTGLRALCRHLAHNNVYAKRAINVRTSHMIGSGIRFHISSDKQYDAALFEWVNSLSCDYEHSKNFYGIQSLMSRTENEAGEAFVIMRDEKDEETGDLKLTLQIIDPDLLANEGSAREPHNADCLVKSGVEYDKSGRVKGYHIITSHDDNTMSRETVFIPVEDMLHFFEPLYPGQLRGIPRAAQVLSQVELIAAFANASLTKAQVEACLTVAVKRKEPDSGFAGSYDDEYDDMSSFPVETLEPGLVWYLRDGEEIQTVNPSTSSSFEPFVRIGLEAIATGYDCTYAQISGDLSRVNFSSEKAGRMEFNRGIESLRSVYFEPLLMRIEERFRRIYELNNGRDVNPEIEITIIPPGRERIDPQKDVLVEVTEMQMGVKTFSQACLARGLDPDIQMDMLIKERKKLAEAGLDLRFGSFSTIQMLENAVTLQDEEESQDAQKDVEDNATLFDRDEVETKQKRGVKKK